MFRINYIARILSLLPLVTLVACASWNSTSPDIHATSAIAICGGGLDHKLTAKLQAEYEHLRGSGSAEVRERIGTILNANKVPAEKYGAYLECVIEVHSRYFEVSACKLRCQSLDDSCQAETKRRFDLCISDEIKGCVSHCKQFRIWSNSECIVDMCNWASMSQESKDFHTQRCTRKRSYINQVAECSSAYGDCIAEC